MPAHDTHLAAPPGRRPLRSLALVLAVAALGVGLLVVALAGRPRAPAALPPAGLAARTPPAPAAGALPVAPPAGVLAGSAAAPAPAGAPIAAPGAGGAAGFAAASAPAGARIVDRRPPAEQRLDLARFRDGSPRHVPAGWVAGFYRLYDVAGRTFGVNWLLLASVHRQETSFSTEPDTYHGLNFVGCCGGPMQFNVTNGPVSTWAQVRDAFRAAGRPAGYPHPTVRHPSIYDDFDAIMSAARLLSADGATIALDAGAWQAAYGYYGHDATGVTYADQVLARAISWSQGGFCINCALDQGMVAAVHAAYGAPALAQLDAVAAAAKAAAEAKKRRTASGR